MHCIPTTGRDRVRDRSVREERGRVGGGRGRQSEGILARESVVEEREVRGQERRQFDIFEDPREVPRSGFFFEVGTTIRILCTAYYTTILQSGTLCWVKFLFR